jgi:predicted metal-binding membrane protein
VRAALHSLGRRPALGLELGIVGAWILLAATMEAAAASGGGSGARDSLWLCTLGHGGATSHVEAIAGLFPAPSLLVAGLPAWGLMTAAMMLPSALPAVRHVGTSSLFWRRRRAMAEFVAVYMAIWVAFTVLVIAPLSSRLPADSALAAAALLALAAIWQLTPLKRRALRACHFSRPLPPRGWRASAGVARFGLLNGGACLASCWALMLTMAAAGPARLVWMAALTTIVVAERFSLKSGRARRRIALVLAVAAAAALTAAVA